MKRHAELALKFSLIPFVCKRRILFRTLLISSYARAEGKNYGLNNDPEIER
jgi:hypothetical protein